MIESENFFESEIITPIDDYCQSEFEVVKCWKKQKVAGCVMKKPIIFA